jgi:hypothetical protein
MIKAILDSNMMPYDKIDAIRDCDATPMEKVTALVKLVTNSSFKAEQSGPNVSFFATADRHPWAPNGMMNEGDFVFTLAKSGEITWEESEDGDITCVDGIETFFDDEEEGVNWIWDEAQITIEENHYELKTIFDIIEDNWNEFDDIGNMMAA